MQQRSERITRWLAAGLLIISLLQVGCGFRPRGSVTELTDPSTVFVDAGRNITLTGDLRKALGDRAFTIAQNRDAADFLLRLTDEKQSQRIVSVRSTGRVSEFELSHLVNMLIAQASLDQSPRYDLEQTPNRVEVIREYTYDEADVLGKENEARILREEMREELIRQIVLRTVASLASSVTEIPIN